MSDIIQIENLEGIEQVRKAITDKHKQVSNIKTPKPFIKKKMGMEYVEYSYMREIADKEFPGWSWKVVSTEVLGSEAYVVHGRLKFYDEGIWRECDVTASHRIQKQRGTNDFVDIGNDIKAANTDCMKKALNVYMDIAADVYRSEDPTLDDTQYDRLMEIASKIDKETEITIAQKIDSQEINTGNYKAAIAKLERLSK